MQAKPGENVPTPFNFGALPVKFISITASLVDKTSAMVKWVVATPATGSDKFEVEYSADGIKWNDIGTVKISNSNQGNYQFLHASIPPGNLYYRIKEVDKDGAFVYSNIVLLRNSNTSGNFIIYPNPANNYIAISGVSNGAGKTQIILYDAVGRRLTSSIMTASTENINTAGLPDGAYLLKIINNGTVMTQKVLVMHR